MKSLKLLLSCFCLVCTWGLQSCNNEKTYAEKREEEEDAIQAWITTHDYKVISESDFYAQDTMTNENEFVLFESSGVYMNILYRGPKDENGNFKGEILNDGNYEILSRFVEVAMQTRSDDGLSFQAGDTLCANMNLYGLPTMELFPEEYKLVVSGDSYSASFQTFRDYGMYDRYQTTSVPSGWLVPFKCLRPFRTQSSTEVARVRLIVPHSEGTRTAMNYVYPCYYELTYNLVK